MPNLTSDFEVEGFERSIRRYCEERSWKIAEINDRRAKLKFEGDSGSVQTLYVIRYERTLEFSVPSKFYFADMEMVPDDIATVLLACNSEMKIGFWCLEKIRDEVVISIMHNQEIDFLDADYFGRIVKKLVSECDKLEMQMGEDINYLTKLKQNQNT